MRTCLPGLRCTNCCGAIASACANILSCVRNRGGSRKKKVETRERLANSGSILAEVEYEPNVKQTCGNEG
jgi:hypothetical protein